MVHGDLASASAHASLVNPVLRTSLKDLHRVWKPFALVRRKDRVLHIPRRCRTLLRSWALSGSLRHWVPFAPPPVSRTYHTDASLQGWGGYSDRLVQGLWSPQLRTCHINILELMAVFLTLRRLPPKPGSHVRVILDNQTAVTCLRRGGSRSAPLNHVVLAIMKFLWARRVHLSVSHPPGTANVVADALSRSAPLGTEWSLDCLSFRFVRSLLPSLQVDLFASRMNFKLPCYVSLDLDPQAFAQDAFLLDWNQWTSIYCTSRLSAGGSLL